MTKEIYKVQRHIIRSIYNANTDPWMAYKKALKVINITVNTDALRKALHRYNQAVYRARG